MAHNVWDWVRLQSKLLVTLFEERLHLRKERVIHPFITCLYLISSERKFIVQSLRGKLLSFLVETAVFNSFLYKMLKNSTSHLNSNRFSSELTLYSATKELTHVKLKMELISGTYQIFPTYCEHPSFWIVSETKRALKSSQFGQPPLQDFLWTEINNDSLFFFSVNSGHWRQSNNRFFFQS